MSKISNLFGIKREDFALVTENPEALKSQSSTVRLVKDKRVRVPGSINGVKIPTYATLQSAYWTRLTVRDHEVRRAGQETRISQVFGGVFKPVKLKVEVEIEGETISLQDLIATIIMESSSGSSMDEIKKIIDETNLTKGLFDGMPLMFQQMGAGQNGFAHAIEVFKSAGAIDDLASLKGNASFHTCYDMKDKQGLEVVSFELGSADRGQSKTGQGFVDIVDAVFSNLVRVIAHKTTASVLKNQIEEKVATLTQAEAKSLQLKIDSELAMSKQYPVIWSGASRQKDVTSSGDQITRDKYNATNAPCGRWTVVTANGNVDLDVWSNSTKQPSNHVATAQVDTTTAPF
jgi:hypothetical protein